jgi:uncharacterized repeat protein (TIGR01451 family)
MTSRGALGLVSPKARKRLALSWSALFILSVLLQYAAFALAPAAMAVHDEGLFELDGNAVSGAAPGEDWDHVYAGTSAAITPPVFLTDKVNSTADDIFTGGSSKDISDTTDWLWTTSKPQAKNDITHAFAAAYTAVNPDTAGDTIVYFGLNKYDASGDNFVGFWFLQDQVGPTGSGVPSGSPFSGAHTPGDVLVLADYTNGGGVSTFSVYKWVASGGDVATHLHTVATGVPCTGSPAADEACGTTNLDTETSPWPFTDKSGEHDFLAGELFEGGINLSALHLDTGCFTSFIAETRSSQSVTATLSDFAGGQFSFCVPPTITTQVQQDGQSLGSLGTINKGESVQDKATLTGSKGTVEGTVDFFECFNAAAAPDCSSGGNQVGGTKTLSGGTATSASFTPADAGFYCFRVDYTPAAGSKYLAASHTNKTTECFQVIPAQVTIAKTADGASVSAGDSIGFTLSWGNSGAGKATGVVVSDNLPGAAGLNWSIDASTGSGSTCAISGAVGSQVLTCNVGTINGNTAVSGTVHVTSGTTPASCGTVNNTGDITSTNDGEAHDGASMAVNCPDVRVVKTAAEEQIRVGDTASFTITVSNIGTGTAKDVELNDPLPGGLTWAITPPVAGCSITSGTLHCDLGDLAPGASVSITVTASTDGVSPEGNCETLPNTATATSTNEPAGALGNNQDSATIEVCTSTLVIDKSVSGNTGGAFQDPNNPNNPLNGLAQAKIGDTLTYTLHYSGTGVLTNAVISDPVPAGLEYITGSATGDANFTFDSFNPTTKTLTWKAATLPDPADGSVTFQVKVLEAAAEIGIVDNVATIRSDQTPPDEGEVPVGVLPPPEALTPPPTDSLSSQTGTGNPGFALMLILLVVGGLALAVSVLTPAPDHLRNQRKDRRR